MDTKVILTTPKELADLITVAVNAAMNEYWLTYNKAEKQFFNIDEAAEYLHLAKQTIYGFTSKREIPFTKRGKKLYFKKPDLEKWLTASKNNSHAS